MGFTRREFLKAGIGGAVLAASGLYLYRRLVRPRWLEQTFIAKVSGYQADFASIILAGLRELGISPEVIKGKRILLKPNLVEANPGSIHIQYAPLGGARGSRSLSQERRFPGPGRRRPGSVPGYPADV